MSKGCCRRELPLLFLTLICRNTEENKKIMSSGPKACVPGGVCSGGVMGNGRAEGSRSHAEKGFKQQVLTGSHQEQV